MRYRGVELHSNEEVVNTVRAQRARMVFPSALCFLLLAAPLYLTSVLFSVRYVGMPLFYLSLASGLLYGARAWVRYRGTFLIITNQRVIDVDRRGFFDKIVSEVPYESLSDVSYRSRGVWETLTGAGTITFQMIGGKENIAFPRLGDPSAVHKQVMELRITHARGTPAVSDPVEDVMNSMQTLSPTERRALLATMKRTVKETPVSLTVPDAAIDAAFGMKKRKKKTTPS
jgi:hypothetical protein